MVRFYYLGHFGTPTSFFIAQDYFETNMNKGGRRTSVDEFVAFT